MNTATTTNEGTTVTVRGLLDLKAGARLVIRTRSGAERTVVLKGRPELACVGKPGIHRVRLWVFDASRMPKNASDEVNSAWLAFDRAAVFEVGGDKVVAVVG